MTNTKRRASYFSVGLALILFTAVPYPTVQSQQPCIPPPSGLVSWWPGDGNANDIADGNPGTLKGGATFVAGMVGQAFSVDANAGSFVEVPDAPNLSFGSTSPITVDLWAFRTSPAPAQHILGKRVTCGSFEDIHYQMGFDNREGAGLFFGSYHGVVTTGADLPLNSWTHLAATFDGGTFTFYINGQLAGTGTGALGPTFAVPLTIGTSGTCHQFGQGFDGLIDEVEIHSRALTASEVQAIFSAGSAGKCKFTSVAIDIKPGSFPNSINRGSNGTVPVAILSTSTFDATAVDPLTANLAGAQVRLKGKGTPMASFEDVNGDGLVDLVVHVTTEALQLSETDTEAVLEGQTFGGTPIRGVDSVRVVP